MWFFKKKTVDIAPDIPDNRDIIDKLLDGALGPITMLIGQDGVYRSKLHIEAAQEIERLRIELAQKVTDNAV